MGAVELFGPPGAGKSTILAAINEPIAKYGWAGVSERRNLGPELAELLELSLELISRSTCPDRGHYEAQIKATLARSERVKGRRALVDEGIAQRALTVALALPGDAEAVRAYAEAAPVDVAVAVTAPVDVIEDRNNQRRTHHFAQQAEWMVEATAIAAEVWDAHVLDGRKPSEANAKRVVELLC